MQKGKMKRTNLSELESCVLGVIWREGPVTAYQVRMAFAQSLTTSWRASTGAIYPLIRKLKKLDLVSEQEIPGDRRKARNLQITESGLIEITRWVGNLPDWVAEPAADTIRTRFYFLTSLPVEQRSDVLSGWIALSREKITQLASAIQRHSDLGDMVEAAAHRGAMMQIQARLGWLESLDEDSLADFE